MSWILLPELIPAYFRLFPALIEASCHTKDGYSSNYHVEVFEIIRIPKLTVSLALTFMASTAEFTLGFALILA